MKFSFSIASFLTTVAAFGGHAAVNGQTLDIPQTAIAADGFDTLVAALTAADLVGAISEPNGPFTVFAPTDEAFDALPDGLLDCLLKDKYKDVLSDILLYHVASGKVLSSQLSDGQEIPTLLDGAELTVDLDYGDVKINDSTVIAADVEATNGVIHVINQVLVPPRIDVAGFLDVCALEDIPTTAVNAGVFNTLVAALDAADLVAAVSEPNGPLTVFAPTDDAFAKLPDGLVSCLLEPENKQFLTDVLLYHVATPQVLSSDLSDGQTIETLLAGSDLTVDISSAGVKINDSMVVQADVLASNGVIHVIDSVLVPEGKLDDLDCAVAQPVPLPELDIPQTAINAGIFNTLVAALDAADLVDAVSEPNGPFTVFAPIDDAFAKLPEGLVSCLLEPENKPFLTDVLLYHVATPQVLSSELSDGQMIETLLSGSDLTVDISDAGVKINDSTVLQADVLASNGVIHVIDSVLVPEGKLDALKCASTPDLTPPPPVDECSYLGVARSAGQELTGPTHTCLCTTGGHWVQCRPNTDKRKTIQQFVLDSDEFTTLEAAVIQAGLVGVLDGDGPFTLFAPTDDAFAAVPSEVLDFLLDDSNKDALGQVLKYHIVSGASIDSKDIPEGTLDVDTVQGGNDKISATKKCFSTLDVEAGKPNCDRYSLKLDDGSDVIVTDVHASNGIIHIINQVLVPPSLRAAVASLV